MLVVLMVLLSAASMRAEQLPYLCELGLQGGIGYYVGDANPHIFMYPREAYGLQFRYKFTNRWALQVKGQGQRIAFKYPVAGVGIHGDLSNPEMRQNMLINVDVVAEFNFFRFGERSYDTRIKPITPYIFLGIGGAIYGAESPFNCFGAYIPMGIGMKWKITQHFGLNVAWQHNIYFDDNLEAEKDYDNTYQLNGSNILNNDITGALTLGIVFEFAQQKSRCRTCEW